ncbi:hypothetical protein HX037_06900 [Ignatzschineria indica]|uniref:hypothetical protein n=1 Tax=Ignatzschineria indica TaxID=472583 RepID=UPI002577039F|nr:hypothetical protein [Ignatzschineria indica]MDM1545604.1 hypothetical protein [Ignatzschineria indica]
MKIKIRLKQFICLLFAITLLQPLFAGMSMGHVVDEQYVTIQQKIVMYTDLDLGNNATLRDSVASIGAESESHQGMICCAGNDLQMADHCFSSCCYLMASFSFPDILVFSVSPMTKDIQWLTQFSLLENPPPIV